MTPLVLREPDRISSLAEDSRRWQEVAKDNAALPRITGHWEGSSLAQRVPPASRSGAEVPGSWPAGDAEQGGGRES